MSLTLESLAIWLERYFQAWQTNDPSAVADLFADDAHYFYGPFREPAVGRAAIVERWVANPPPVDFNYSYAPLAVNVSLGVAQWHVSFQAEPGVPDKRIEIDGILVLKFDDQLRCTEHREWYNHRQT